MSRHRLALVSLATVVALAAAACGGGGESGEAAGEDTTQAVPATTWMGTFCTALDTWRTELTEGAPDLASVTDVAAAKDSVVSFLDGAAASTQTLVDEIEAAGVPDVENGEAIATDMRDAIASVGDDFSTARDDVEGLSTDDPAAFAADLSEIGTTLDEAGTAAGATFDRLADQYPAADLDAAAQDAAACENVLG